VYRRKITMMIANNFDEFVTRVEEAERVMLNTKDGQKLTQELLKMKLEANPNLTPEEWKQTKSEFMTFIFYQFVKENPEIMEEFSGHVYNKLREA
jgi:DNA-directed RNA polymerase alpha subunit